MSTHGIAIIGCGDMGGKHATAWSARSDTKVIAVCDPDNSRAEKLAQSYGAQAFDRWQDAIALDGVDIVSICVPAIAHRDIAVAAANAGQHILCEKPMALTLQQADEMIAAAKAKNVQLSVCHQYRSLSRFKTMQQQIAAGKLGNPLYIRFSEMREVRPKLAMHTKSLSGGPVHDMAGHLFDLGRFFTGAEAKSVMATGTVFAKGKERMKTITDFGVDTAEILVKFHGGHSLSIGINWGLPENTPGHCQDLVHGPLGMAYTTDNALPDRFLGDPSETLGIAIKTANGTAFLPCDADENGPEVCVEALLGALNGDGISPFDGHQGRAALALIIAALESIESGQTVEIP